MLGKLRRLILFLIGDFSWKPPGWIARPCRALAGWCKHHRRQSAAIVVLMLAAVGGGWWRYEWEKKQPKPVRIKVTAVAPGVTPLAKELRPMEFIINFSGSVARLDGLKRVKIQIDESRLVDADPPSTSGIRMEPPAEGDWRWGTESRLILDRKSTRLNSSHG